MQTLGKGKKEGQGVKLLDVFIPLKQKKAGEAWRERRKDSTFAVENG